ncbi:MAG: hypothetical protein IKW47_04705 [Alistipes sp.]|nr:hypothetical protein [Alistipes sp.]
MANFLPIVKILESTNISVRGLGQVVVDPATIEVGNNSVVARCRIEGIRGYRTIKCYCTSRYRDDIKGVDYYPQSLKVYGFNGRVEYVDVAISRWERGEALDIVFYRGGCDFRALSRAFDQMAHKHLIGGVVHGDIKPENIIVRPSGKMTLIDSDDLPLESLGNYQAKDFGSECYVHRHRHIRRTDQFTDHYPLALHSTFLAALIYEPRFLYENDNMERYIATATQILKEHNDSAHYDMIVAMTHSIMGKVDGLEALFESIVMADE